jgi:putative phage-type endonuclease
MKVKRTMAEIIQGSDEWFACRAGKVTASRVADVISKGRGGEESASRRNYKAELVCERLTGKKTEGFTTKAMADGVDREPLARALYESKYAVFVDEVAFVEHPTIAMAGASPDGLVGEEGCIEIKSPQMATHIDYFKAGVPVSKYIPQMAWQLACTGRKWVDFVSFNPDFPDYLQLFVVRYHRDDDYIRQVESEVMKFLVEVDEEVIKLQKVKQ